MTNSERKQLAKKLTKLSLKEREEFSLNHPELIRCVDPFTGLSKQGEKWYDVETGKLIATLSPR